MIEPLPSLRPCTATYRLQLHAGFTFDAAADVVPYLADLGVSHLYLSPVLAAVPGSQHGYDVLDHDRVNPELGGREGLERLAEVCRRHDLGIVVDIVPNHMALVAPQWRNAPLWLVLAEGQAAPTNPWFDVDWAALDGRFGLPVLGRPLEQALAAGEITLDTGGPDEGPAAGHPVVRYYDHVLPVAAGTGQREGDDIAAVLDRQHYVLAEWTEAETVLNYRRFFEVDQLIGVRVEQPDVFEATHRLLLELHHDGVIDGFRVDHPDGLADPQGYLETLAARLRPGAPLWVEKILEGSERLPAAWPCSGSTGYDALAVLQTALADPASADAVSAAWVGAGGEPDLQVSIDAAKQEAVQVLLRPEVARLHRRSLEALPQQDPEALVAALTALLAATETYRAYVRPAASAAGPTDEARATMSRMLHRARSARPDLRATLDRLVEVLLAPDAAADPAAGRDLAVRFQQTTGPVMAKGIEDTAFYRWHRLVALNEVGADPAAGHQPEVTPLHTWAGHQAAHWPHGMTTLSTHDTKRSADVRARLLAVAGDGPAWQACTDAALALADQHEVDHPTAHLVWQTLLGVGRVDAGRVEGYLVKALREGKQRTTWTAPDEGYEARVLALARDVLDGGAGSLGALVERTAAEHASAIRAVTLGQKLLQLTIPGVPDTYQGTETLEHSLVDPDNRRPVDYVERRERLARLDRGAAPADLADELLLVTATTLRLRRVIPAAFAGGYRPIRAGAHLVGFARGDDEEDVVVLATRGSHRLEAAGGWGDASLALPAGRWVDELSAREFRGGGDVLVGDVLATMPVALLTRVVGGDDDDG